VVAVSEGGQRALVRATGRAIRLVENGVELGPALTARTGDGAPRVLFAGVLTPRKGVVDLLLASRLLAERGVPHELVLAGGTPDEGPDAEAEVRAAAEGSRARFLGAQPHEAMTGLYREADVFCLPSWWEAMPLSVLEAMASGLPVVASMVGDIPRAVEDGVTGRLVPPRQPAALADALEPLLRDRASRRAMGLAGRQRAEREFDLAETVNEIDALYREIA
jgi:glycosyltransferase involved in cell wall biosynthesis